MVFEKKLIVNGKWGNGSRAKGYCALIAEGG